MVWAGRGIRHFGGGDLLAGIIGMEKYRQAYFDNEKLLLKPPVTNISASETYGEYLPISANRDEARRWFPAGGFPHAQPKFLKGEGQILGESKNARHWTMEIQTASPCEIIVPQYWFLGWKASSSGSDSEIPIQSESKSGLIQIEVPIGRHVIDLRLRSLWPEQVGQMVSYFTINIIGLIAFLWYRKRRALNQAWAREEVGTRQQPPNSNNQL